jgi:acetyltransferase-like isoleucine patch superfamily enzyme
MFLFKLSSNIYYLFRSIIKELNASRFLTLKYGTYIDNRCVFYGSENIYFDHNVSIGTNSLFSAEGGEIKVGENTSFNSGVHINASVCGKIFIGKNCLIGPNVVMRTADHIFANIDIPIRLQGHKCENIILEEDVWIGANVVITGGVTIGKGCVIGAGSVVTKNIPEFSIAVGIPARVIKSRK